MTSVFLVFACTVECRAPFSLPSRPAARVVSVRPQVRHVVRRGGRLAVLRRVLVGLVEDALDVVRRDLRVVQDRAVFRGLVRALVLRLGEGLFRLWISSIYYHYHIYQTVIILYQ